MSTKPSLTIRRRLNAPPAKVYDAWTDPAKMTRWFGPEQSETLRAVPPPLQYRGAGAYRKNWEQWLPTIAGPIGYEICELSITAGDDVAFCHSLDRISGTGTNGEKTDVWVRATVGYRKIDGEWMVRMSTCRCLSTWTPAKRSVISSRSTWRATTQTSGDQDGTFQSRF